MINEQALLRSWHLEIYIVKDLKRFCLVWNLKTKVTK